MYFQNWYNMNLYIISAILLILKLMIVSTSNDYTIKISPSNNVTVGQTVKITCHKRNIETTVWSHNGKRIGEKTTIYYNKNRIDAIKTMHSFILTIEKVTINESGNWTCSGMHHTTSAILFVIEPWSFKPPIARKLYKGKTTNSSQEVLENGKKLHRGKAKNSSQDLLENGKKMYPYKLSRNVTLLVMCQSECGLPAPKYINFKYQNRTSSGHISNGNKEKLLKCPGRSQLLKMTNQLEIDCYKYNLWGKHKITCESTSAQGSIVSTNNLYIQCPVDNVLTGITQGEIIAIIFAVFLAILNVILIVYLLKQNLELRRNHYKSPSDASSQTSNYFHNPPFHHQQYSSQVTSTRSGDKITPSEVML